jgi:hypothetical protein
MSAFKRQRLSGTSSLAANYISSENSTSTAASSFVGVFVYSVQYGSAKVSVAADTNGTITVDFSNDGVNVRETITDSTVGGASYFRVFPLENQFIRVSWVSTAGMPTSLVIYTVLQKIDASGLTSPATSITAGTGISVAGTPPTITIANTAPDQTVALTAGTGISATGTYPNFTITNTAPDQTVALTAGTNISVTGTYPNFTITNTASAGTDRSIFACVLQNSGINTSVRYFSIQGNVDDTSSIGENQQVMPIAGTISRFYVKSNGTFSANRTFTLYKNGSTTSLTATITAGGTTASDTTNSVSVVAGDLITWGKTDASGSGPNTVECTLACVFTF